MISRVALFARRGALFGLVMFAACQSAPRSPPAVIPPASGVAPQIAFLADVHLHDVYGSLGDFSGLPSRAGCNNATLRTMYAQLTSTRLFNENYFVLRAALDDAYARGVRLVALPGDATDDGQPVNVAALKTILAAYQTKGVRFFLAPGNHDPHKPFDDAAFKDDFLGVGGTNQRIYSMDSGACRGQRRVRVPDPAAPDGPEIVCTDQIKRLGYAALLTQLNDHGYMPSRHDLYWESPFSRAYDTANYTYAAAQKEAAITNRQYELCHEGEGGAYKQPGFTSCAFLIDASYLVEPIAGVWLLAIDANVYVPKVAGEFDADSPARADNYEESSDAGYNAVLTHKRHLISWVTAVTRRARAQGKRLIAFSHFPMSEFYNGQSEQLANLFLPGSFQLTRRPSDTTTQVLAATGLQLHIGGHMHLNNTGLYTHERGARRKDFLVNVQVPALGVFGAAYKLVTLIDKDTVDVQTIALENVPRFDELFPHYATEWQHLRTSGTDAAHLWPYEILRSKNFHDFTRRYFGELARLRFLPSYWPCPQRETIRQLDGAQLLTLSQLRTPVTLTQLQEVVPGMTIAADCAASVGSAGSAAEIRALRLEWAAATTKASQLAAAAGLSLADFADLGADTIYGDFHRALYAGELVLHDLGASRLTQYKVLMAAFRHSPQAIAKVVDQASPHAVRPEVLQVTIGQVFSVFKELVTGVPSGHFRIDFAHHRITDLNESGLTFN